MPFGTILKGIGGFYYVRSEDDQNIYECKPRGIFRKDSLVPVPGDKVVFSILDCSKKLGNIDEIQERKSELIRPAIANIDQIAIVVASKAPNPDFSLLDKLLITAEMKSINVIICVNKCDLDDGQMFKDISEIYGLAGYDCIELSSVKSTGFRALKERLKDRITVFAGQSGVGKSTILNHILEEWVMETGSVSDKIERGKHTTRHAELLELKFGGYVADTPGFSSFEISIPYSELENYYPEIRRNIGGCRFTSCSHISEPDCPVKEAVDKGEISQERYQRYIQLYTQLKSIPQYGKKAKQRKG